MVEGLIAIFPFERDKELLNWDSVSYPIEDRVPCNGHGYFLHAFRSIRTEDR